MNLYALSGLPAAVRSEIGERCMVGQGIYRVDEGYQGAVDC